MPIVFRVLVWLARMAPRAALAVFQWYAADLIADLILASTRPGEHEGTYAETLRNLAKTSFVYRKVFLRLLKASLEEAAWNAFVAYAERIRHTETDEDMREAAEQIAGYDADTAAAAQPQG